MPQVRGFLYIRGRHHIGADAGLGDCVRRSYRKNRHGRKIKGYKNVDKNAPGFGLIDDMGIGITIGNTLDAIKVCIEDTFGETGWGNPKITRAYIQALKSYGYKTVKLPVSWNNHINFDDPLYAIDPQWMARVTEVVQWVLDEGMYCIINMHHDAGIGLGELNVWNFNWNEDISEKLDPDFTVFRAVWKQIAENFKNTSEKLIFEGFNEIGFDNIKVLTEGLSPTQNGVDLFNRFTQIFVDTVRAARGKNKNRYLIVPGIWHSFPVTLNAIALGFRLPDDTAGGKLLLGLHYFHPSDFAFESKEDWGTPEEYAELENFFQSVHEAFVQNNIPIVLTEYLCGAKNQLPEARVRWMTAVTKACLQYDICPVHWEGSAEIERIPPYSLGDMLYAMWQNLEDPNE